MSLINWLNLRCLTCHYIVTAAENRCYNVESFKNTQSFGTRSIKFYVLEVFLTVALTPDF